ncbi:MAG TPA: hypothetical protein PLU73_13445 [Bacteroidia bacterium]|nr:hypothetical protein [Bacteroidia bacterium]
MGRVWIYIISKELSPEQLKQLQEDGSRFVKSWTAHDLQLHSVFEIYKNRILLVKVDESMQAASGCSTDKLSRFIKETEQKFGIELLNRLLVAIKKEDGIEIVHASKIGELLASGLIKEDSVIYNTAAANSEELSHWEKPLKDTWLKKYMFTKQ